MHCAGKVGGRPEAERQHRAVLRVRLIQEADVGGMQAESEIRWWGQGEMNRGALACSNRCESGGGVEPHPVDGQHHIDGPRTGGAAVADHHIERYLATAQHRATQR